MGDREDVLCAQLVSKNVLEPDEKELYELTQLAGVQVDPEIFKILLDLLKLNVPPAAIVQTLRSMCSSHPLYPRDENQPPAETERPPSRSAVRSSNSSSVQDRSQEVSLRNRSASGDRRYRMGSGDRQREGYSSSQSSSAANYSSDRHSSRRPVSSASTLPSSSSTSHSNRTQSRTSSHLDYDSRGNKKRPSSYAK